MRSARNNHCFQILKELSQQQQCRNIRFSSNDRKITLLPNKKDMPHTARKAVFAQEESRDFIQTVRCKTIEKYIAEQTPTLTEQSCLQDDPHLESKEEEFQGQHQIDAIFTQLEDYLIDIKVKFTGRVRKELADRLSSGLEKKQRCEAHLRNMKNLLHYIKQITEGFLQPNKPLSLYQPQPQLQTENPTRRLKLFHN